MIKLLLDFKTITLLISCLSLTISFLTLLMNRKRLDITIEYSGLVDRIETFDKESVFPNQTTSAFIIIKALNMSPKDIGFFDIQFLDAKTLRLLPGFYKFAIRPEFEDKKLLVINDHQGTVGHFNPINSNYGLVPANSMKRFETVVYPCSQTFIVDIKVAIKTFKRNPYATTRKYYKHYSKVITLSDSDWKAIQKSLQQVQQEIK
ncbi:hypothetical protein JMM81_12430 [Bacillus sp. V3B]|uniref:hypothetical protein n=1 Tax=Bacillus sp. V3B TaxID=2804915 RepID=UPI00210ED35C|nr:hypothetical protein [Bacillus sp. V3B]MCQ6275762.1 hypothetical protein [Bacillus sp. V3B]